MVQSRFVAASIHLAASATVLAVVFAIVLLVWYPGPFFSLAGAREPSLMLLGVDLVIGPLLTLIVYNTRKPGLRFDLSVIIIMQLAALCYGSWVLASQRPVFVVLDSGYFEVVAWPDVERGDVPPALRDALPLAGPLVVWAEPVSDPAFMSEVIEGGRDVNLMPDRYRDLARGRDVLLRSGERLSRLMALDPVVRAWVIRNLGEGRLPRNAVDRLRAYPVFGRRQGWAAVVDPAQARVVAWLPATVPWSRQPPDSQPEAETPGEQRVPEGKPSMRRQTPLAEGQALALDDSHAAAAAG